MARKPAEITDTELAIMGVLWDRGACEVRDIVEVIYPAHSQSRHTTVKSLLERLAEKGYVESDTSRFAHTFSALVSREQYVGQQLQKLADSHFDGSLAPMLMAMVDRVKLSRKERDAIRKLIEGIQ